MTMSDRIAVMNSGRYEQLGDPEVLYERPTTRVRGGLPRGQQPAARRGRGQRRDLRHRPPRRRHARPRTARPGRRRARTSASASGRRRSACTRTTTEAPAGHNHLTGVVRDASYLGVSTQYLVEARGGAADHGLRAERRARHQGRAVGARRGGPADLVARPHASSSERDRRAGGRPRRPPSDAGRSHADRVDRSRRPMTERSPPDRAAITRRPFVAGVGLTGVAAFLAACGTGARRQPVRGGRPPRPRRPTRPRPPDRRAGADARSRRTSAAAQLRELAATTSTSIRQRTRPSTRRSRTSRPSTARRSNYQEVIDDNDSLLRHASSRSSRPARTPAGTSSS